MNRTNKVKLTLLRYLGYSYFIFVPLISIALIVGAVSAMFTFHMRNGYIALFRLIIVPLAILVWYVLRGFIGAVFSRVPAPEGLEVTAETAPALYALIEDIRQKAGCPPIDCIKLDAGFNAYIAEIPTLGLLFSYQRYLVLGAPLLVSLSEQELTAVIAHECAHLAGVHGKQGMRIERVIKIWERIYTELKKKNRERFFPIDRFMWFYLPALNNAALTVRRQQELSADETAAQVAGKQNVAVSLAKSEVFSYLIEDKFWRDIHALNKNQQNVPDDIYLRMQAFLCEQYRPDNFSGKFERYKDMHSLPGWSHPSESERIDAIGASFPTEQDIQYHSGSLSLLAGSLIDQCNALWKETVAEEWADFYRNAQEKRDRLAVLRSSGESLSVDERIECAFLTKLLDGAEAGTAALRALMESDPDHPAVQYHLGCLLLDTCAEEGIALLEKSMENDIQGMPDCCEALMQHYKKQKNETKAAEYYDMAVHFMKTDEDIAKERDVLQLQNIAEPHDLPYRSLLHIIDEMKKNRHIRKAYIAKLSLEYSSQFPVYVLGFTHSGGKKASNELRSQLTNNLMPWDYWVIDLNANPELACQIDSLPDSRIL